MATYIKLNNPLVKYSGEEVFDYVSVGVYHSKIGGYCYVTFNPARKSTYGYEEIMMGYGSECFNVKVCAMPRKNQKKMDAYNEVIRDNAGAIADAYRDHNNKVLLSAILYNVVK